ncbi:RNA recognition motif domain-containing protein [Methylomonas koyamae]|uniref:RRM domain-containing protein n=1 Tax=Methylomonas koyamae TaxID=702114 RepID=A0A177PDD0_9GAMM|nr:RNA-binding protein [Methylomonas koyamae]ATG88597.1 hypothetical protein MKLM6_0317 [Methylomonas koyamae]OAI15685.1 hypothetical protein A1507_12705 [Methylomonas koyamae]OAI27473.1 hypothetical protein A1356_09020 [Methylomonas koyamae]BBL56659.1 hypothetical protein MKFW12EY_02720 [Methylomonas koyamae]
MILIVKNIPSASQEDELADFVAPALRFCFWLPFKIGHILKTDIFCLKNPKTNGLAFHGRVFIDDDKAGRQAIKKLHGKRFNNKVVEVREYFIRSGKNDRRAGQQLVTVEILEQRKGDRRCHVKHSNQVQPYANVFDARNVYQVSRRARNELYDE